MKIIPLPDSITLREGTFCFSRSTEIDCASPIIRQTLFFFDLESAPANKIIFVKTDCDFDYVIDISDSIRVTAATDEGLFHAAVTLRQLIFEYLCGDNLSLIPKCVIKDAPRYAYRSFMLDVSRHFFPVSTVKKVIDAISAVKLNKLHLHLSDDQGFRLSSDNYPKLAQIASVRAQTRGDGVPHEGFYTKTDIAEIVSYAAERFVEVVPEIDLPGHTQAILAAYPELGCSGEKLEVSEHFGVHSHILCAGNEKTYEFIFKLLDEIADMFPSKYFHIGGDEAPKLEWSQCPECNERKRAEKLESFEKLQGYFTNRIVEFLKSKGKTAVLWNEALYSRMLRKDAVIQYWADGNRAKRVTEAANDGRNIIVSKLVPYYLDYPHGMSSLRAAYNFDPELKGLNDVGKSGVLGTETPLWTEYVTDEKKLFEQAFPRAIAVAETAWSKKKKDYRDFRRRLLNVTALMKTCLDVQGTPPEECDPNPLKGAVQMIKFGLNAADKSLRESRRNARDAKRAAKREE